MSRLKYLSTSDEHGLARHVVELRSTLRESDPRTLSRLTACSYHAVDSARGEFRLRVLEQEYTFSYPEYLASEVSTGKQASIPIQALLVYYFQHADGARIADRWVAFSELPEGRFYNQAFQGYTGRELTRSFGEDIDQFSKIIGNLPKAETAPHEQIGDRSFPVLALPRVPLLLVFWQGDEDFPPSYQILFDASVVHYLPTDVCAILGSMLTRKLIAARQASGE